MNNIQYKFSLLLFFLMSIALNAQDSKSEAFKAQNTQTLCNRIIKNYKVNEGKSDTGNTYTWKLTDASSTDLSDKIVGQNSSSISIDWADSSFTIGETYTLTVEESNGVCTGEIKELSIALTTGYLTPDIEIPAGSVCDGPDLFFKLKNGTPQSIVSYNISSDKGYNSNPNPQTIKLDENGAAEIAIPNLTDSNAKEIFTLILISVDDDETDSCSKLDINSSENITVLPKPNTSEISFD